MLIAGTASWWACTLLGQPRPLFAVLVPLVAMGDDPFGALNVSLNRVVGVFAGVVLGIGLLQLDLPSTLLVALLLALSLGAGLLLRPHSAPVNNQVAITALFMLYLGVAARAETVGVARIWETAVGAAIAVATAALLWAPDPVREARERVERLHRWLREDLARAANLLEVPDARVAEEQLEQVRERSLLAVRDLFDLERGERALHWNPRHRRDQGTFAAERARLTGAARQYRHLRTIARTVADLDEAGTPLPEDEQRQLTGALKMMTGASGARTSSSEIDLDRLHDPRAMALGVKIRQMRADMAAEPGSSGGVRGASVQRA